MAAFCRNWCCGAISPGKCAGAEERPALRPLPTAPLSPAQELRVPVSRLSTIQVLRDTYSVPSRLIGSSVLVRVRAETLELYQGTVHLLRLPRLLGRRQHHIDYRHIRRSLVRKPVAFAQYRYHDDLFPTLRFRQAYDRLQQSNPQRADREYVRVLHLAATHSEVEVDAALALLDAQDSTPTFEAVRTLVRAPALPTFPALTAPELSFAVYDQLVSRPVTEGDSPWRGPREGVA